MVLGIPLIGLTIGVLFAPWKFLSIVTGSMDVSVNFFRDSPREISSSTDVRVFPVDGVGRYITDCE